MAKRQTVMDVLQQALSEIGEPVEFVAVEVSDTEHLVGKWRRKKRWLQVNEGRAIPMTPDMEEVLGASVCDTAYSGITIMAWTRSFVLVSNLCDGAYWEFVSARRTPTMRA